MSDEKRVTVAEIRKQLARLPRDAKEQRAALRKQMRQLMGRRSSGGRPGRGPEQDPKTHAVSLRTSKKLHDQLKASAAASGWSTAEEISQRLARTFNDDELMSFLAWGKGNGRTDLVRLIIDAINSIEKQEIAAGNPAILELKDWSTHKERALNLFEVLEAILHMVLLDGIAPIRGRENYAAELQAIGAARMQLMDDPAAGTGSLPEFAGRLTLLLAGYRCTLPVAIEEQDESERQALDRAKTLIDKMKARPNDPSEFLSARVRDIMRRVEKKQADRREADFGAEVAPLLEAAYKFVNFAEGGDYIAENSSAASDEVIRAEARKLAESLLKILDGDRGQGAAAAEA